MSPLLSCRSLDAGYDGNVVVRDFDLDVAPGDVVALLGPNGAGKTTLLLTLAGLLPRLGGSVELLGEPTPNGKATAVAHRGLVLVPDDRSLFAALTTRENIALGMRKGGPDVGDMLSYFPALEPRLDVRAGMLSGGEQQMLAMARGLIQQPRVLLIDELSMGLAPVVVEALLPIVRAAADTGASVLLVEQHVQLALGVADRAVVLVHGEIAISAAASELLADLSVVERAYLGDGSPPPAAG
jgi:branched-chain amino acid transport system ATP-binding protein